MLHNKLKIFKTGIQTADRETLKLCYKPFKMSFNMYDIDNVNKSMILDFPGGAMDRNQPTDAEDTGLIPGLGKFHIPQSN